MTFTIPQRSGASVSLRVPGELAMLREQLKPPNGGVFLGLNGIVIKSHGGAVGLSSRRATPFEQLDWKFSTKVISRRTAEI
jgi:fatty acid/phospholipid biosynthesis enzyme